MRRRGKVHSAPVGALIKDLARLWPFLLVGPMLLAIRIPGPVRTLATWIWVPVGVVLLVQLSRRISRMRISMPTAFSAALVFLLLLSLAWTPELARGIRLAGLVGVALAAFLWAGVSGPPPAGEGLRLAAWIGIGFAVASLVFIPESTSIGGLNPDRILGMGVLALMVIGWYAPHSWWYGLGTSLAGLAVIILSGSRTATLVAVVLIATHPGFRMRWPGRALGAIAIAGIVVAASLSAGLDLPRLDSAEDVLDVGSSGRFELWPAVARDCGVTVVGRGAGASDGLSVAISPAFPEPHNEYLRIWCDTGIVGSLLAIGFVLATIWGAGRGLRRQMGNQWAHHAALQMSLILLIMAATDNPLTTAIPLSVPAALAVGWSLSSARDSLDTPGGGISRRKAGGKKVARGRHLA